LPLELANEIGANAVYVVDLDSLGPSLDPKTAKVRARRRAVSPGEPAEISAALVLPELREAIGAFGEI